MSAEKFRIKADHTEEDLANALGIDLIKTGWKYRRIMLLAKTESKVSKILEEIVSMSESLEELVFMVFYYGVLEGEAEATIKLFGWVLGKGNSNGGMMSDELA